VQRAVVLSGRNLPNVHVMPYAEASAYDVLWAEALVIEESAIGGHVVEKAASTRVKRAAKAAAKPAAKKTKTAKKTTAAKKTKATKKAAPRKKKGGKDA
jgi:hypothetical protein